MKDELGEQMMQEFIGSRTKNTQLKAKKEKEQKTV